MQITRSQWKSGVEALKEKGMFVCFETQRGYIMKLSHTLYDVQYVYIDVNDNVCLQLIHQTT